MSKQDEKKKPLELTNVISTAIKIPGVKVTRETFLREQFKGEDKDFVDSIIEHGPVLAGCSQELLRKKASRIVKERTAVSSGASFLAGIPGGLAMAATIPADILQFYGVALRMAQELVYLYGEADLWCEGTPDPDRVTNQLIIYCGVMLGASGAASAVRIMSSALANQAMKKLPQMALTKTFYYPIVKSVLKFFGVSVTKSSFAKGVSKVIPVIGGIVSGGLTLASMYPMGKRLSDTLDQAHFDYTYEDFEKDFSEIANMQDDEADITIEEDAIKGTVSSSVEEAHIEKIKKAKDLLDAGIIDEEEFKAIKEKIIAQI